MDILKWGIDNNYINFTLTNFVGNHQWEMLQELKDDPNRIGHATTFNVYESI